MRARYFSVLLLPLFIAHVGCGYIAGGVAAAVASGGSGGGSGTPATVVRPAAAVVTQPPRSASGSVAVTVALEGGGDDEISRIDATSLDVGTGVSRTATITVSPPLPIALTGGHGSATITWNYAADGAGAGSVRHVQLRIVPTSAKGGAGAEIATGAFFVGDRAPTLAAPPVTATGRVQDVIVPLQLEDDAGDGIALSATYSVGGAPFQASLSANLPTSVPTAPGQTVRTELDWSCGNDPLAATFTGTVEFQVSAEDALGGITTQATSIHLDNNQPPVITFSAPARASREPIAISCSATDAEGDDAVVTMTYVARNVTSGATLSGTAALVATGGENPLALATSTQGATHVLLWDAGAVLPTGTAWLVTLTPAIGQVLAANPARSAGDAGTAIPGAILVTLGNDAPSVAVSDIAATSPLGIPYRVADSTQDPVTVELLVVTSTGSVAVPASIDLAESDPTQFTPDGGASAAQATQRRLFWNAVADRVPDGRATTLILHVVDAFGGTTDQPFTATPLSASGLPSAALSSLTASPGAITASADAGGASSGSTQVTATFAGPSGASQVSGVTFQTSLGSFDPQASVQQVSNVPVTQGTTPTATITLYARKAGVDTVLATPTSSGGTQLLNAPLSVTLTVAPGAPERIAFTPSKPLRDDAATALQDREIVNAAVALEDHFGNVVPTGTAVTIGLLANPTGDPFSGLSAQFTTAGTAQLNGITLRPGTGYQLAATGTATLAGVPTSFVGSSSLFDVGSGPSAQSLVFLTGLPGAMTATNGVTLSSSVEVVFLDGGRSPVTTAPAASAPVALYLRSSPDVAFLLSGPTAAVNGVATFPVFRFARAGTYTLEAQAAGLVTQTAQVSVAPGAPAKVAFVSQPTSIPAGGTLPTMSVQLTDRFGNLSTATGVTVTMDFASGQNPGNAALVGPTSATTVAGVASFGGLSIQQAGNGYALQASLPGVGGSGGASNVFNVTGGSATKLVFSVQPQTSAPAPSVLTPVSVEVTDAQGNPFLLAPVSVTVALLASNGATLGGTKTLSTSTTNGTATFSDLTVSLAGTGYQLSATSTTLTAATSDPFTVASKRLVFLGATIADAVDFQLPQIQVQAQNADGSVDGADIGASVTLLLNGNPRSAVFRGTLTQTLGTNATATFTGLQLDKVVSAYTMIARGSGFQDGISPAFNATIPAPSVSSAPVPVSAARPLAGRQVFDFGLSQPESRPIDAVVEFDPGTGVFQRATSFGPAPAIATAFDGIYGLPTSGSGVTHAFGWQMQRDVPLLSTTRARLRVTPSFEGVSFPADALTSSAFAVGPRASFSQQTTTVAGATGPAVGIAVVDVNGDGKPDVIILENGTGQVLVFLSTTVPGATTPSFAAPVALSIAAPQGANGLAVADLDGDGRPDIIVATSNTTTGAGQVAVFRNVVPAGTTTLTSALFTAETPVSLAAVGGSFTSGAYRLGIGDFNGDGKPDIVVTQANSNQIAVLLNQGGFAFAETDFGTPINQIYVVVADLNGDGRPDIAVGPGPGTGSGAPIAVSVFLNATAPGATTPSFQGRADIATVFTRIDGLAVGDLNRDGRPDLVASNGTGGIVALLNTTSAGATTPSFAAQPAVALTPGSPAQFQRAPVAILDLNGDGVPDIAIGTEVGGSGNGVQVLLNLTPAGASTLTLAPEVLAAVAPGTEIFLEVAAADLNGDGRPDLVLGDWNTANNDGDFTVFLNTTPPARAGGDLAAPRVYGIAGSSSGVNMVAADFDGDGKIDVALTQQSPVQVAVLPGHGDGSFESGMTVGPVPSGSLVVFGIASADFDGDGRPDIAFTSDQNEQQETLGGGTLSILANTSSAGAISFGSRVDLPAYKASYQIAVGDFDGDGKPDVVTFNRPNGTFSVYRNTSSGVGNFSFTRSAEFTIGGGGNSLRPNDVAVADLDGDGKLDVVFPILPNQAAVFINTSTGPGNIAFATDVDFPTASGAAGLALADLDGDGRCDIAVVCADAAVLTIYRNAMTPGSSTSTAMASPTS